jgi:uncharacterized protein YndB with AHSA1/START domain
MTRAIVTWHYRYKRPPSTKVAPMGLPSRRKETNVKITVETNVAAPMETVWEAYTTPEDIKQWNTASNDWHTTAASVDLREGGAFSSRTEAKDGSMGFDFAGTYTKIIKHRLIEYSFGGRTAQVVFTPEPKGVGVRVTFDSETTHSTEQQRDGWQAILNKFARYVRASGDRGALPATTATMASVRPPARHWRSYGSGGAGEPFAAFPSGFLRIESKGKV